MRKASLWIGVGFLFPLILFFVDWEDSENPQLRNGFRVVRYLSSERQLKRSSFMAIKEKNPSQFVDWMFSTLGTAEWPPYEDSLLEFDRDELNAMRRMGIPFIPKNVALVSKFPDFERGKQVVVKADDKKKIIILEGFINPKDFPVIIQEIKFPNF